MKHITHEHAFRLISLAILAIVAILAIRPSGLAPSGAKTVESVPAEPTPITAFNDPHLEIDAAAEAESINAGQFNPFVVGSQDSDSSARKTQ